MWKKACSCLTENYEVQYSRTSHNGPSEKRTTSVERTKENDRLKNTVQLMHYKPPRSSQADASELRTTDIYHAPYCTQPIHFCLRKADSETTRTPVGHPPVSVCASVYVEPPYFAPARVCYVNNDLAKESCCSQGADQFLHLL